MEKLGKQLREWRMGKGLGREEVAAALGRTVNTVRNIENGQRPGGPLALRIQLVLNGEIPVRPGGLHSMRGAMEDPRLLQVVKIMANDEIRKTVADLSKQLRISSIDAWMSVLRAKIEETLGETSNADEKNIAAVEK
jgi:transcriptional regulator with XRE-family HTH domain